MFDWITTVISTLGYVGVAALTARDSIGHRSSIAGPASSSVHLGLRNIPLMFNLRRVVAAMACSACLQAAVPAYAVAGQLGEGAGTPSRAYARLFTATPTEPLRQAVATAQVPEKPRHSGLGALVRGVGSDFAAFPRRRSTWVLLGVGAGAAAIAHPFDDETNDRLQDADGLRKALKPGKYLGYGWVQGGTALGLYLTGRFAMAPAEGGGPNRIAHLGFDLLRAQVVTQTFTYAMKQAVRRDRPTGECCSFPSGHASATFATAAVLERHFGYRASWPMFAIAGYVAASRLTDNRHFASDVLFGSALGMAAGWTVVGRHGRDNFAFFPVPVSGGIAVSGTWSPKGGRRAGS